MKTELQIRPEIQGTTFGVPVTYDGVRCEKRADQVHVLVAEDEVDFRLWVTEYLNRGGYSVTAVEDGHSAWDALQSNSYDLLITDNQMPRLTGADLILKVRLAGMALPIIVITADPGFFSGACRRRLRIGEVIEKPIREEELLHVVGQVLGAGCDVG